MAKRSIYFLGLITLFIFPIPSFVGLYFFEDIFPLDVLALNDFRIIPILYGTILGLAYGVLSLLLIQAKVFDKMPNRIEHIVKGMNLTILDCVFLSICAGVGEELLFRSGIQFYLGPIITSILFVAIHGYLNPRNWRMSLYGLIVLPFIFLIAYAFEEFGLWFCIFAHFSYDLVLFIIISRENKKELENYSLDQ